MSMVVSFFAEVLIPFQSPLLLHPHATLICLYQSVCYMENLYFIILGLCNGSKHKHLSTAASPSPLSSSCAFSALISPPGFSPKGWKYSLAADCHVCVIHRHHLAPC